MQDVAARTNGKVRLGAGTLFSSIRGMLEQGLVEELRVNPDPENHDERRRYYRLSRLGRPVETGFGLWTPGSRALPEVIS